VQAGFVGGAVVFGFGGASGDGIDAYVDDRDDFAGVADAVFDGARRKASANI